MTRMKTEEAFKLLRANNYYASYTLGVIATVDIFNRTQTRDIPIDKGDMTVDAEEVRKLLTKERKSLKAQESTVEDIRRSEPSSSNGRRSFADRVRAWWRG